MTFKMKSKKFKLKADKYKILGVLIKSKDTMTITDFRKAIKELHFPKHEEQYLLNTVARKW